jgi:hypothetical protein
MEETKCLKPSDSGSRIELDLNRREFPSTEPPLSDHEVVFEADSCGCAEVKIVMPLYNYACYVEEAFLGTSADTSRARHRRRG